MANSGINKALVIRARKVILARGEHPSIDRVRIELGNTGSRTTIARYLSELNNSTPAERGYSPNEELMECIHRISVNLKESADTAVEELKRAHIDDIQQLKNKINNLTQENLNVESLLTESYAQNARATSNLEKVTNSLELINAQQNNSKIDLAASDVKIKENDTLIASLKNHLESARGNLQHFMEASKRERENNEQKSQALVENLSRQLIASENRVSNLESKLEEKNHEIIRLTHECSTLIQEKILMSMHIEKPKNKSKDII